MILVYEYPSLFEELNEDKAIRHGQRLQGAERAQYWA